MTYDQALTRALKVARRKYERLVADDEYGAFHRSHHAAEALERAEEWLEKHGHGFTFGVESASVQGKDMYYLNSGDTYADTLCWDQEGEEFFIGCWGDWQEAAEQEYCEENDSIHCGYCGAFTPLTEGVEWRETVCESCGWYVDGGRKAPVVHAEEEDED